MSDYERSDAGPRDGLEAEYRGGRDYRDPPPPRPRPAPAPAPAPPKPAPKKEPVVEKYADGTVETRYPDGSINRDFRNGNSEFIEPSGEITRNSLRWGTAEHVHPDGSRELEDPRGHTMTFGTDGTVTTRYPDGNFDLEQPDGTVERWRAPDGKEPQRVVTERRDGSWDTYRPDGTVITTRPDRTVVIQRPDGTTTQTTLDSPREIRDQDGTVSLLYPNGNSETRRPDGSVSRFDQREGSFQTNRPDGTYEITYNSDGRTQRVGPEQAVTSYGNGVKIIESRNGRIERTNEQGHVIEVENPNGVWEFHRLDGRVQENWMDGTIVFDRPDGIQQIFWPDNSEELRDLLAGDQPVKPPDDIPILAGPAATGADPGTPEGVLTDEMVDALDARGVVGRYMPAWAQADGMGDDILGVPEPMPANAGEPVRSGVGQAEPVAGVTAQASQPAFDDDPVVGAIPDLGEESIQGWDPAPGVPETVEPIVEAPTENDDADWAQ